MQTFVWSLFIIFIIAMLAIDLGFIHKERKEIDSKEALRWTIFCSVLAILFTFVVYVLYEFQIFGFGTNPSYPASGLDAALEFFSAWLLEQSLSLDNVFLIAVIFSYFKIPSQYQHRILFWGILGALIMRGAMIGFGAIMLKSFAWAHLVFGGLLIIAAIKMAFLNEEEFNPAKSFFYKLALWFYPLSPKLDGEKFFTKINDKWAITPLFLVLILIETTDILFALDSIPAVFAITEDPFIVFTSNIFAILSLRSMYFALAALVKNFHYLKVSLLGVLVFVGAKMIFGHYIEVSVVTSFAIITSLIGAGVVASLIFKR